MKGLRGQCHPALPTPNPSLLPSQPLSPTTPPLHQTHTKSLSLRCSLRRQPDLAQLWDVFSDLHMNDLVQPFAGCLKAGYTIPKSQMRNRANGKTTWPTVGCWQLKDLEDSRAPPPPPPPREMHSLSEIRNHLQINAFHLTQGRKPRDWRRGPVPLL